MEKHRYIFIYEGRPRGEENISPIKYAKDIEVVGTWGLSSAIAEAKRFIARTRECEKNKRIRDGEGKIINHVYKAVGIKEIVEKPVFSFNDHFH